jgi:hypothetical protein
MPEGDRAVLRPFACGTISLQKGGEFQGVEQFRRGQSIAPKLLPACLVAVDVFFPE